MSKSRKLVILILFSYFVAGCIDGLYIHFEAATTVIQTLFIAISLFTWCGLNASERGIIPPRGAKLLCGLLGAVGVPYYYFKILPTKEAAFKVMIAAFCFFVAMTLYVLSSLLSAWLFLG